MDAGPLEIAVVHHRTPTVLTRCLEALARHAPEHPVTVIDTALDPTLPGQLAGAHPRLEWRAVPNHSLAAAVNTAVRRARSPFVMHMNADVFVEATTVRDLLGAMRDPEVALAGPLATTERGTLQDLGLPYRWHYARLRWRARRLGAETSVVTVPWLSGCLQLVRREAVQRVGGMDTSLRFYNEDLEWCLRLRRAGYRCALVATPVTHLGGASTTARGPFLIEGLRGGYAVTRRYARPAVRTGHRLAVWLVSEAVSRLTRDAERREVYREVARRFRTGDVERSSFGATLDGSG